MADSDLPDRYRFVVETEWERRPEDERPVLFADAVPQQDEDGEWVRWEDVKAPANALAGLNPEALPKLLQELDAARATGFDRYSVRWIGDALDKLRREVTP